MHRRHPVKFDSNHSTIAQGLRDAGVQVIDLARYGCSPDILALGRDGHRRVIVALEIKGADGRLTGTQTALLAAGWPLVVVTTLQEALEAVGWM